MGNMNTRKKEAKTKARKKATFDAQAFLDSAGFAKKIVEYWRGESIFEQGDPCDGVMYVQKGGVKLSVRSKTGREAVVAMVGPGDFFGEGCLAGQPARIGSATASTASTILILKKKAMVRLLHEQPKLADRFIAHLLGTNIRIEQELTNQLFNHNERRLARTLLLLARYGKQGKPQRVLPHVSQPMLAKMVGTTRANISFFMKKFERLGFIEDDGGLTVNKSLLSVVLHD
jgi:CRP/FNR family transcriptional regulator, cyclic AMP receptor protein